VVWDPVTPQDVLRAVEEYDRMGPGSILHTTLVRPC
jgi:hypothetical protein